MAVNKNVVSCFYCNSKCVRYSYVILLLCALCVRIEYYSGCAVLYFNGSCYLSGCPLPTFLSQVVPVPVQDRCVLLLFLHQVRHLYVLVEVGGYGSVVDSSINLHVLVFRPLCFYIQWWDVGHGCCTVL